MFPLSIFSKRRISRSNNFEPIHSFRENTGLRKYFYFIPKITGVLLERLLSNIFVISSQDLRYYKYFWSPKKICVVPLRNLVMANKNNAGKSKIVAILILILPAFGIVSQVLETLTNKGIFGYIGMV